MKWFKHSTEQPMELRIICRDFGYHVGYFLYYRLIERLAREYKGGETVFELSQSELLSELKCTKDQLSGLQEILSTLQIMKFEAKDEESFLVTFPQIKDMADRYTRYYRGTVHNGTDMYTYVHKSTDKKKPTKKKATKKKPSSNPATAGIWEAYSKAFFSRYGTDPVRNAKSNSLVKKLHDYLGEDAKWVAEYYVGLNEGLYVSSGHDLTLAVRDASKLRMMWATKRSSSKESKPSISDRLKVFSNYDKGE